VRIAIDARELGGRPTGVGRYLAQLLATWATLQEAADHSFVLFGSDRGIAAPTWPGRPHGAARCDRRVLPGGGGTWWEQVHLAAAVRRERPDVLFAPAYTGPLAIRTPMVLTVHDLSFVAHPEWFPIPTRIRRRALTWLAARRARLILADSEFSRGEIVRRLGVPAGKVRTVPLGLTAPAADASRPPSPREPLVLYVGSVFNRRHVPELIAAVARVAERHPETRLEIVGDNRTHPHQDIGAIAASAGMAGRTSIRSYVADEVLAGLYARAGAFAFLSDYEGFGLTPLEALRAGVPILVGDTPVAREVYRDAAAFVAPGDVAGIAAGLESLLFDREARAALLDRAPAVLGRYSWERAAKATLAALVEAAG
jgi:glycosyltransferase involved in cell wall biosynthesis